MKKNTPAYRRLRDEAFEWYFHSEDYKRDQEKLHEELYRDLFDGYAAHLARTSPHLSETERHIRAEQWAKNEIPRSLNDMCIDYGVDGLIRRYLEACPKQRRDGQGLEARKPAHDQPAKARCVGPKAAQRTRNEG